METVTLSKNVINQGRLDLTNTVTMVTINDDDGETVTLRIAADDGVIIIISKDAVISMVTATMTTTEGGVVDVCANLVSPSGGTSVPITIVFTWSGGV